MGKEDVTFLYSGILFLLPSVFPSIRVFSNKSVLHIRWPKYWSFSFSTSPSNEQSGLISLKSNWLFFFFLRLTGLISLLSKGLSRVFSGITVRKHQFLALSLLYSPTLISIHDYWKNHSFDYMNLYYVAEGIYGKESENLKWKRIRKIHYIHILYTYIYVYI